MKFTQVNIVAMHVPHETSVRTDSLPVAPRPLHSTYMKIVGLCYPVWTVLYLSVGVISLQFPPLHASLAADASTPFLPGFVWIYLTCYIMPLFLVFVAKDWHRVNMVFLSLAIAHLAAFGVFLNFPVDVAKTGLGNSFAERFLSLLYHGEPGSASNNLPSLHVSFAFTIAFALLRQSLGKLLEVTAFVWASLIALSTLFVRQHVILDVASGLLLTAGCWTITSFAYPRLVDPSSDPLRALHRLVRSTWPYFLAAVLLISALTVVHRFMTNPA